MVSSTVANQCERDGRTSNGAGILPVAREGAGQRERDARTSLSAGFHRFIAAVKRLAAKQGVLAPLFLIIDRDLVPVQTPLLRPYSPHNGIIMARFELKDSDYSFNASLDPFLVLKKMGFTENSVYQEGDIVRVHCPIHKDLVRKSLIIDVAEKTFRCQYSNCEAHEGGLLVELVALYYDCGVDEVAKALFGQEDKSSDLLFRGEMFINQGRHLDALPYLEQACDLDPRNEVTRCKLAALYLELNRKDDAYREYLQAAESYAVRGELEKTLAIYNILIMLQPGAVKARKELSFLFSRMGRPDAAAEQLKWVVDFYLKYNQIKGAQEACDQIMELDPDNAMGHILNGILHQKAGKRVQAMTSYEAGARKLIDQEDFGRAISVLEEAIQSAPGNPRLKELLDEASERQAAQAPEKLSDLQSKSAGEEQAFIEWLANVDSKLATGEGEIAIPVAPALRPDTGKAKSSDSHASIDIPLFQEMREGTPLPAGLRKDTPRPTSADEVSSAIDQMASGPDDTSEISPEDRRVAMCLNDLRDMDNDQIESMRQQLLSTFADVRKTYDDGLLSEWEMRTIKEFYKAFCVAVDIHRASGSTKG